MKRIIGRKPVEAGYMKSINEIREQIESEMENIKKPLFSQEAYIADGHVINAWLDRRWDTYAEGYLRAGHALVEQLINTKGVDQDFLIYPIVFVYRQYLELRLKELLRSSSTLFDESFEKKRDHKLLELWRRTRPLLERVWPESSNGWYEQIGYRITELATVDPDSMSTRYPDVPMRGLEYPNNYINPIHLRDVMTGISHVLEGSSIGIGEYLNAKHEMEAEYREMNEES